MNEKKEKILNTALKLFSEKGYHETSIQEVADRSGVSKGAVYLHFRSKDDLILSIFKYYIKRLTDQVFRAEAAVNFSPKENFIKQIHTYFLETLKYKEFIKMQFREQIQSLNDDIKKIMMSMFHETESWYERNLFNIYGEPIEPYIQDVTIIMNGMIQSYLRPLFKNQIQINVERLATFIFERTDDMIQALIEKDVKPMITKEQVANLFANESETTEDHLPKRIQDELNEMESILEELSLDPTEQKALIDTITFLQEEARKEPIKPFIFKGMLANLDTIDEFKPHRDHILMLLKL